MALCEESSRSPGTVLSEQLNKYFHTDAADTQVRSFSLGLLQLAVVQEGGNSFTPRGI